MKKMSDRYESFGDGDLTPEQLDGMDMWDRDVMLDERHRVVGAMLVRRAVAEIRRHRAVMRRLEFWAEQLEEPVAGVVTDARPGVGGFIAQELRNRINGA
jgi:hypothetical protein